MLPTVEVELAQYNALFGLAVHQNSLSVSVYILLKSETVFHYPRQNLRKKWFDIVHNVVGAVTWPALSWMPSKLEQKSGSRRWRWRESTIKGGFFFLRQTWRSEEEISSFTGCSLLPADNRLIGDSDQTWKCHTSQILQGHRHRHSPPVVDFINFLTEFRCDSILPTPCTHC